MAVTLDKDAYYRRVKRLYSNWREFPGSVSRPFRCSRIIHRRQPRAPPPKRESPAVALPCGHHHLPGVPARVILFPP
uniref:SPT16 homolog, facilitates chromatin remodeling subunit n=1 Tax=Propithecus coquereli TaxID=379532 RepID=A0A2K6EKI9_PROCO